MRYKVSQIDLFLDEKEVYNITKVIESRWLTEGPFSHEFLEKIKEFTGAKYAVLANNGTLGLYLSLLSIGIKAGDEVIVPNFTFNASASSIVFAGAKPVFVDINESDLQIDSTQIERAITPKTKAIMPVHIYGQACDMAAILAIATDYGLKVVEDAAQGFGVFYKGQHTGTIGDIGMISFFADKTITTGEGAVVLTNDKVIYEKLKLLRNQGRPQSSTFVHPALGMNFRMTDLQSALGVAQIEKFPIIRKIKIRNYNSYKSLLQDVPQVRVIEQNGFSSFVPFRVNVKVDDLDHLIDYLEECEIQTRRFFYPLHRQPCYQFLNYKKDDFPTSNKAYEQGLSLPVHCNLREGDIEYICSSIKDYYENSWNDNKLTEDVGSVYESK